MKASRVAVVAAITSAVAWGLKAVAIGIAGGLDRSPSAGWVQAEAGLWFSALLAVIVTTSWHTRRGAVRTAV